MSAHVVVLVGPMGAGKSSIGRKLAKLREWPLIDTDKVVEQEQGVPIATIFAEQGEAAFRSFEREAVAQAVANGGVVALGGGAVTDSDTRALLATLPVVHLTISPEAVAQRVNTQKRPLLQTADPIATWKQIAAEREPLYREVADLTVDTSRLPMAKLAAEISQWLDSYDEEQT